MFGFGALACSLLPDGAMHATYNLVQHTRDGEVLVTVRYADGREEVSLSTQPVLLDLARAIDVSLVERAEELQGRSSSEGKQVHVSVEGGEGTPVFPEWLENLHSITVSDYSYSPKDASAVGWVFDGGRRVSGVTLVKGVPKPANHPPFQGASGFEPRQVRNERGPPRGKNALRQVKTVVRRLLEWQTHWIQYSTFCRHSSTTQHTNPTKPSVVRGGDKQRIRLLPNTANSQRIPYVRVFGRCHLSYRRAGSSYS